MNAADLLARPRYLGGGWYDTHSAWRPSDDAALKVLVSARADPAKSADALGRSPSAIAWRASESGFELPAAWKALIAPKKKRVRQKVDRTPLLAYPYVNRRRTENELLLAVNGWVPRWLPGREDVCQEIMLAILEKRITIDALVGHKQTGDRAAIRAFIRSFKAQNLELSGYALSLDAPVRDRWGQETIHTIGDRLIGENSFDYWNAMDSARS